MAGKLIEINDLYKAFGDKVVLNGVTLHVEKGENLVVFGRSGTGKSVLLKCIVRLLERDRGSIHVFGDDVNAMSTKELTAYRKRISFLFQSAALYDSMSVRENLSFALEKNYDFSKEEINEKVLTALKHVSLEEAIDKMPSELSGGMRKRIGLARAIITEPEIMFYDEPTTGLDPITSKEISQLILDLQRELDMTSIAVTHDLLCAEIIADRAIVLREGNIIFEGTMDEIKLADDPFLQNFFSDEVYKESTGSN